MVYHLSSGRRKINQLLLKRGLHRGRSCILRGCNQPLTERANTNSLLRKWAMRAAPSATPPRGPGPQATSALPLVRRELQPCSGPPATPRPGLLQLDLQLHRLRITVDRSCPQGAAMKGPAAGHLASPVLLLLLLLLPKDLRTFLNRNELNPTVYPKGQTGLLRFHEERKQNSK